MMAILAEIIMNTYKTKRLVTQVNVSAVISLFLASEMAMAQTDLAGFATDLASTIVYSIVGIVMGVIGFKVVDWLTPGNLAEEVANKENRALAILAGSMMLGVCIIIASVLIG